MTPESFDRCGPYGSVCDTGTAQRLLDGARVDFDPLASQAVTLGLALAFEPNEANTMRRPPRARNEPLLTGELVLHITLAVNTLVVMEVFRLLFIRNIYAMSLTWGAVRGNKVVWLTVALTTVALSG